MPFYKINLNHWCIIHYTANVQSTYVSSRISLLSSFNSIYYQINPHWSDERLYQEGRKIMGATTQHITYNEFLPRIIGLNAMNLYDLRVRTEGYSNDYDPTCNPSIYNEFATAAFR